MQVLVTGGYGNLGGWLLRHLTQTTDWKITVLSHRKHTSYDAFEHEFILCDIANTRELRDRLSGRSFDLVYHLASVNDSFVKGYDQLAAHVNVSGTKNLVDVISKHCQHVIYLSTFQVYGTYEGVITEETPTAPKNTYASSHLLAENVIMDAGIPYSIIRLTNSYGCPISVDTSKWYLILNDLARMAYEQQRIQLKGNGGIERDFIPMAVACEVLKKLAEIGATNRIFNLGSETTLTLHEVAIQVQSAYAQRYEIALPVIVPIDSPSEVPLNVHCSKLKQFVPYEATNTMIREAKHVFELLDQHT